MKRAGEPSASLVVDLGFGDSGKGTIVDYLVRARGAGLVVRWNGGAQAGHTVVLEDGRHHVFAQFGAGTFVPGVRTHLAEPVVIHPTALFVEARRLAAVGVADALARLTIAGSARVIAPLHQSANRLRELARGEARHGSCGVGVGEAVRDALAHPDDALVARDLVGDRGALRAKLARVRERLRASLETVVCALHSEPRARAELAVVGDATIDERWIEAVAPLRAARMVVPDEALGAMLREGSVVLEGAQGVLLDEHRGFHPHTTWSTCTLEPALALLAKHDWRAAIQRYGVLRTYLTRHGDGPFPTEDPAMAPLLPEPHNPSHGWQGGFRVGALDLVLARYARAACGGVDALALTHLDRLPALPRWRAARAYRAGAGEPLFDRDASGHAIALRGGDLAHQERLARALSRAEPLYDDIPAEAEAFASWLASELATPVALTSHGPTARDKREPGRRRGSL
jgi:adenylosuccinate synthase